MPLAVQCVVRLRRVADEHATYGRKTMLTARLLHAPEIVAHDRGGDSSVE